MAGAATSRRTPPVNAELTEIGHVETERTSGGGYIEVEVTDWEGSAPAYVTEKVELHSLSSAVVERFDTILVIPSELAAAEAPGFGVGYTLRFNRGATEHVREVTSTEDRSDAGFIRCWTKEVS